GNGFGLSRKMRAGAGERCSKACHRDPCPQRGEIVHAACLWSEDLVSVPNLRHSGKLRSRDERPYAAGEDTVKIVIMRRFGIGNRVLETPVCQQNCPCSCARWLRRARTSLRHCVARRGRFLGEPRRRKLG